MSLTFMKRSALPEPVRGKVGTNSVTINSNGQVVLSSIASKFLNGTEKVFMAFDATKVYLFTPESPVVSKAVKAKQIAENDGITLRKSKKSSQVVFSASTLLQHATEYGASVVYDYKGSGNQTFPATEDEKNGCITFTLPVEGRLTPKPVMKRTKRLASVGAEVGSTVAEAKEEELTLDPA